MVWYGMVEVCEGAPYGMVDVCDGYLAVLWLELYSKFSPVAWTSLGIIFFLRSLHSKFSPVQSCKFSPVQSCKFSPATAYA